MQPTDPLARIAELRAKLQATTHGRWERFAFWIMCAGKRLGGFNVGPYDQASIPRGQHNLDFCVAAHEHISALLDIAEKAIELADSMETCHHCKATVLVEEGPIHCEDCSFDCDDHEPPECTPLDVQHRQLRAAIQRLTGEKP